MPLSLPPPPHAARTADATAAIARWRGKRDEMKLLDTIDPPVLL
jgi:hypothetical protein